MPTLPVYIRVDDLEKWKALTNKSEFIHHALNPQLPRLAPMIGGTEAVIHKPIKSKDDVLPAIKKVFPEAKFEPLYRDKKNKRI